MPSSYSSLFFLLLQITLITNTSSFSRDNFPTHFVFGSGTSAYQVEGAAAEDGRTPSVWDTFAHSGMMDDNSNGDIACDQYHKYKEDVQLMVNTGLDAYRFSISWSRLIPNGRGPINPKGLRYYNNLIDELIKHGIQPHATLFHLDLPQVLEDEYGGWLSPNIVKDFTEYADVCFREFGDRVKYWTTLNEPNALALGGYDLGICPPRRCSSPFGTNCTRGNSTTEPYIISHMCILSHASVAQLYKSKYQVTQHGYIGYSIYAYWLVPLTNTSEDVRATQRANEFFYGWILNPFVFGDYPEIMKKTAGSKIPSFTLQQSKQIKGSFDFLGLNYYMTEYIKDDIISFRNNQRDVFGDAGVKELKNWDGVPPGELPIDSSGLQGVLESIKQLYGNPPIYIHENGQRTLHNASLNDTSRVQYLNTSLACILHSMRNGSDVRGYFTWSFLDVFELTDGYKSSYGLYYVDFKDPDLKRYPKLSAHWYSTFLKERRNNVNGVIELKNKSGYSQSSHFA